MIKRFCDRCGTELSKDGYVCFNMNVYGLDKFNNNHVVAKFDDKDAELCYKCAEFILRVLEK